MRASIQTKSAQIATWVTFFVVMMASGTSLANQFTVSRAGIPVLSTSLRTDPLWLELSQSDDTEVAPEITPEATDLLARVRGGFALATASNSRIQAEINWFVRHPAYMQRVFERAQRYLPHIAAEIERRDMPLELALLPIVESAYDPFAYSHGRAAGLWQIIPGTASRFGIRQNWWYDGRRDLIDSTNGALNYLSYLHDLMDGDWLLAVASYNTGEGNVLKSVRRNRSRSQPTDFWHLKLSRETSAYVPRLLALVEIIRDPEAHGVVLPEMDSEPQFVSIDAGGQIDLALAAELAGIDLDLVYRYNAGFNRWATDPAGPHRLLMPVGVADEFQQALADVPANERLRWTRHKVKSGETISEIAEQYHTTLTSIRTANDLRGNTIRAGSHLMIPVATRPLESYGQSADSRRRSTQNRPRKGVRLEHVVVSGDSFWSIGQKYGVTARQLASWNGTAPRDTLAIGQKLVVWTKGTQQATPGNASTNSMTRKLRYTVRSGDSLYLIANRFRISVNDLARWNNIDKNKLLHPGQKLTMYVDVTAQSS